MGCVGRAFSPRTLVLVCLLATSASAATPGVWQKAGPSAQLATRCLQVWECVPISAIAYGADRVLRTTPNQSTVGVCSAGGGAVDGCNVCLSSPPRQRCEWSVVDARS